MIGVNRTRHLVEQARTGEKSAFDALMDMFKERIRAGIEFEIQSKANLGLDREEILQETFCRAYEGLERFEWHGGDSFYLWLRGIARNVVLKQADKARQNLRLEFPEQVAGSGASPSRVLRRKERLDRLDDVFAQLQPEYREALRLARLKGLSVKEIARRMDRTEYSVYHLLARAILKLRQMFGETESLHLEGRPSCGEGAENGDE